MIDNPPLKYHGGKHYLAPKIVALMPPHIHYVEPFAGGLAVLLAKDPKGISEVANDLNGDLTNFWTVLRNPDFFPRLQRACEAAPFSEELWRMCVRLLERNGGKNDTFLSECEPVQRAWAFFVCCRQSLAGRMKSFAPLSKTRTRQGMNEQASAWLTAVEGLPAVHERLKRVVVLNRSAIDVIPKQDGLKTLFYCDPPYLSETRTAPDVYAHEMTIEQHHELLDVLNSVDGYVMLSGYRNEIYDKRLGGWIRHDFNLPNNSAGGGKKRRMIESLWCNWNEELDL